MQTRSVMARRNAVETGRKVFFKKERKKERNREERDTELKMIVSPVLFVAPVLWDV